MATHSGRRRWPSGRHDRHERGQLLCHGRQDHKLAEPRAGRERGGRVRHARPRMRARSGGGGAPQGVAAGGVHRPGPPPPLLRQAIHGQIRREAGRRHLGVPRVQARGVPAEAPRRRQRVSQDVPAKGEETAGASRVLQQAVRRHQGGFGQGRAAHAPRVRVLHPRRAPAQVRAQLPADDGAKLGDDERGVEDRKRFPANHAVHSVQGVQGGGGVHLPRRQEARRGAPRGSAVVGPVRRHAGTDRDDVRERARRVRAGRDGVRRSGSGAASGRDVADETLGGTYPSEPIGT